MDEDFVREVNNPCVGEATQYAALHDAHERALMPEIRSDRDDAGRLWGAHCAS